jgi:NAD(P)-dependent dehydrogenase (short-subunit alcohol dehydrogenase family)
MGKNVVITGVSRGLGRAMVEGFIAARHTVHGCGRTADVVEQLDAETGSPHSFTALDVADDGAVAEWAEDVIESAGPPDLLINNAAIINRNANLWEVSAEEFDSVIDINIKGVANVIRHFIPAMIEREAGVLVNISSGWGRSTSAEVAPYCATKWAIEGLSQALAQEVPPGMAVVPLNPGVINTAMLQSCFGSSASDYPAAREWVATAVPFLLGLGPEDNGRSATAP